MCASSLCVAKRGRKEGKKKERKEGRKKERKKERKINFLNNPWE
jgi:hypothetical protein